MSFKKASKAKPKISRRIIDKLFRVKVAESLKIETASSVMLEQLGNIVKGFPSLESVDIFYREIADVIIGLDRLKETLGSIDGYRRVIRDVTRNCTQKMKSAPTFIEVKKLRKAGYGRLSSVIRKAGARLELLGDARNKLRKIVSVNADEPTIVVAGAPNVGKSSLVRLISSAKPEVAEYPFTTRNLVLGHLAHGKTRIQVIDTPGLLDRPLDKRNPLELQAIVALRHLAKMIMILFDPSETCGYSLNTQISISREIKELFAGTPRLIVINKADILTEEQVSMARDALSDEKAKVEISALTGKGIDALINIMYKILDEISRQNTVKEVAARGD